MRNSAQNASYNEKSVANLHHASPRAPLLLRRLAATARPNGLAATRKKNLAQRIKSVGSKLPISEATPIVNITDMGHPFGKDQKPSEATLGHFRPPPEPPTALRRLPATARPDGLAATRKKDLAKQGHKCRQQAAEGLGYANSKHDGHGTPYKYR